jgi:ferric-dicitrate binding protein FerR (iron transport regulator)
MNSDCRRWAELADLDALGEPLAPDQRAFQRAHEASCADCAREARAWRSLAVREDESSVEQHEVESILSLAATARARRPSPLRHSKSAMVFVVGALACAAAILLWLGKRPAHGPQSAGEPRALGTLASVAQQRQSPPPAPVPSPRPVESDEAPHCSQVVPGATVCLARGAALARRALSGPHRELEVAKGRAVVSLEPQPPGTSFSLTTASGKVTAVGTIFSVDVGADGTTVARVVEGKVVIRVGPADISYPVQAGQAFRFGDSHPTPLSDADRDLDLGLLSMANESERVAPATGKARPAGEQPRARDTLEYARSLRASGDFRRAADVYRKIHAENPQSPSGRAALVSLGELLLTLHDPQGALGAFDSYLVGGGALAQEAAFGRVRALRALNRPAEEQRAIQRFLATYPDTPQSRILRARLAAIQK